MTKDKEVRYLYADMECPLCLSHNVVHAYTKLTDPDENGVLQEDVKTYCEDCEWVMDDVPSPVNILDVTGKNIYVIIPSDPPADILTDPYGPLGQIRERYEAKIKHALVHDHDDLVANSKYEEEMLQGILSKISIGWGDTGMAAITYIYENCSPAVVESAVTSETKAALSYLEKNEAPNQKGIIRAHMNALIDADVIVILRDVPWGPDNGSFIDHMLSSYVNKPIVDVTHLKTNYGSKAYLYTETEDGDRQSIIWSVLNDDWFAQTCKDVESSLEVKFDDPEEDTDE